MASNYGYGQYAAYGYAQATQAAHIGYGMMLGATAPAQQAAVGYGQQPMGAATPSFTPPQPVRPMATPTAAVAPPLPTAPGTNQASYYNYVSEVLHPVDSLYVCVMFRVEISNAAECTGCIYY